MPAITNKLLSPEAAFKKYGYVYDEPSGLWRKSRDELGFDLTTEQWLKVDGGWLCFVGPRTGFGSIPFGWPVASLVIGQVAQMITGVNEDGSVACVDALSPVVGLMQVPQGISERFAGVSGLHPASHPNAFRWVWTDDEVAYIYQFAEEGWVKEQAADGTITMRRAEE